MAKIKHIALTTKDPEKAAAFYKKPSACRKSGAAPTAPSS